MTKTTATLQVYQLRIGLRHLRPPIWRRVLVPNVMTLEELHTTIQLAMGWENAHLHEFIVNRQSYGDPTWDEIGDMLSESKVRLADLGLDVGSQFSTSTISAMIGATLSRWKPSSRTTRRRSIPCV
ncbi:MAG: plasmid pRiA4b ORF-3 family protein [Caldilineaceae bacterium]